MGNARDLADGETRYVNASGDTMTGSLTINTASNGVPTIDLQHSNAGADNFKIMAGTTGVSNSGFSIRDTDATANRLIINSNGHVTMPNVPAFFVKGAALSSVNASGSTIVPAGTNYWNSSTLEQNGGTNFDISNARFTAPVSGWYTFNFSARVDQFAGSYVYITLVSSRDGNIGRDLRSISTTYQTLTVLTTTYMAVNDYVYPELNAAGDSSINWDSDTFFSGHLVG